MPLEIKDWPAGLPTPPALPTDAQPHPVGVCCSPFEIGDALFWDLNGADGNMPPLRVRFQELTSIQSAEFALIDNKWIKTGEPIAEIVSVVICQDSIYPCHRSLFPEDLFENDLEVLVTRLTLVDLWPVLELA